MNGGAGHRGRTVFKGCQDILDTVERGAQVVKKKITLSFPQEGTIYREQRTGCLYVL